MTLYVCGIAGHLYGGKKYVTKPNGEIWVVEKCVRCSFINETKTYLLHGVKDIPQSIYPKKLTGQS